MEKVAETSQIDEKRLLVYDGWFKDTLPKVPDNTRFALIHLDCDLYQSTIEVLDACFRRKFVQEGTMFIFQDWNFHRGDPEFGDIKAWSEVVNEYNVTFSDAGHFAALGKKIIVRSYSGINSLFNRSG